MKRSLLRDMAIVVIAGAATPYVLVAVFGSVHAAIRGPSGRIAAFLSPGIYRPRHNLGIVAIDAVLGIVIGLLLAMIIARFTRSGRMALWLAFAVALMASALVVPGPEGLAGHLALLVRQPMILFALCGASLGFWLGPRAGGPVGAAH